MRHSTHLRNVAPALGLVALASVAFAACAKSASDCALLGLPDGCSTDTTTTTATSTSTGGSGGSTTTTTSSSSSTASTTTTSMGGGGTGGATTTTSSSVGGGGTGGAPANEVLPTCGAKFWGDAQDQAVRALVTDPIGAAIAGDFKGEIDLGIGALTAAPAGSMFVGRFDSSITASWSKSFDATFMALTSDAVGGVYLAGQMTQPLAFGGPCAPLDPANGGFFLVKLDALGTCVYAKNYKANITRASLAVDASGKLFLAGGVTGTEGFGGMISAKGGEDIVLASFDIAGSHVTTRIIGGPSDERAVGIAIDPNGMVFATGTFTGTLNFASGGNAFDAAGHVGVFAAGFNAALGSAWSKHLKSANDADAVAVVAQPSGAAVGGTFVGSIDPGGGPPLMSTGGGFFLVRYGTDGTPLGQVLVDGYQPGAVSAVAAGSAGEIVLAGSGLSGLSLARIDAAGMSTFTGKASGSGAHHRATGAAFLASGQLLLGGFFDGSLHDTTSNVLTSAGGDDALLLKICFAP